MVPCIQTKITPFTALPSSHLYQRQNLTPFKIPTCPSVVCKPPFSLSSSYPLLYTPSCKAGSDAVPLSSPTSSDADEPIKEKLVGKNKSKGKSFWGAVSLIIGTAVGPGMLGLPSATIRSGPVPSTIAIILSWMYVVSSIVLVAELSFAAMEEDGVDEVSFTGLATNTLGANFAAFVAVIYASLSFSLLIACVSGIGSLVSQQFPLVNPVLAHALFPCFIGVIIGFFPFKAIDVTNRLLCGLMLVSITALVVIGLSVGRSNLLGSLAFACWRPEAISPAIPVTVLTLGFHVITPFMCKIVGDSVYDARKAILLGGAVPLAMVLSWNAVILGLAGRCNVAFDDPIKLLLSVNSSALPAVRGFAFAALATSMIGYAVSFPKQLADTVELIKERFAQTRRDFSQEVGRQRGEIGNLNEVGQFGFEWGISDQATTAGMLTGILSEGPTEDISKNSTNGSAQFDASSSMSHLILTWLVLIVPIFITSFFSKAFSKALDFAGVYANCFLFGVLPPAMAWVHRSRKRHRLPASSKGLLPGGAVALMVLFGIAVILGFWH
ncbi:uncharacterized protein [Typha latifolia]|uniref:uncharacterized protein n=1 Tax=Typha latifolia TaxID=4733 RepID=UPI003C2E4950